MNLYFNYTAFITKSVRINYITFSDIMTAFFTNHFYRHCVPFRFAFAWVFRLLRCKTHLVWFDFLIKSFSSMLSVKFHDNIRTLKSREILYFCIFFSGMMSLTGVYLGFLESSLFLDTSIFHQYQPPGYPNPTSDFLKKITGFSLSNHISGFQTSINYSAYIIISCLGILNFMQYKNSITCFINIFNVMTSYYKCRIVLLIIILNKISYFILRNYIKA